MRKALVALKGASSENWFNEAEFKILCAACWDEAKAVCGGFTNREKRANDCVQRTPWDIGVFPVTVSPAPLRRGVTRTRETSMNPSYLMVRRSLEDAMARYGAWVGSPELAPPLEVAEDDAIDLALEDEQWKGLAVYIFVSGAWTVFEELSGGLADRPIEEWVRLADGGDLVYAGYNDAIGYGEFVRVDRGQLVRQFLEDEQDPSANVNVGKLPENVEPMMRWTDVAKWVDEEEETFTGRKRGWLWIHRTA